MFSDFIMGWKSQQFLQDALDDCTNESGEISDCPHFTIDTETPAHCTFDTPKAINHDDCHGPREGLPVDVPIQYGPELATTYKIAGRKGVETTGLPVTDKPSTYSEMPTLTYSPVDPQSSKSALGGIVVAKYSSGASGSDAKPTDNWGPPAAMSSPTTTPSPDVAGSAPDFEGTSYITSGNTVMELFIDKVDVTVTATSTATQNAKRHHHAHRDAHHH